MVITTGLLTLSLAACGGEQSSSVKESADYPTKSISIIAPSGAGGGLDTTARSLSKVLADTGLVEQTMLIENKPGVGRLLGSQNSSMEIQRILTVYIYHLFHY